MVGSFGAVGAGHTGYDYLRRDAGNGRLCLREPRQEDDRTNWIPSYSLSAKAKIGLGSNTGADVYMVKPFEPEELVAGSLP